MAKSTNNFEQEIERTITLYLQSSGIDNVSRGVADVLKKMQDLIKSSGTSQKSFKSLNAEAVKFATEYITSLRKAKKEQEKVNKMVAATTKQFSGLGKVVSGAFGEIGSGLKELSGLGGFGKMVNEAINYDKSLLKLAASTTRLGVGFKNLESKMIRISATTSLTRKETISLFDAFNKTYKFSSFRGFESLLERVQDMVGSNKDAISDYMTSVTSLSQNYSGLAQAIVELGKTGTDAQKEELANRAKMLYLANEIGDADYRNLIAVIQGGKQVTNADKRAAEVAKARIDAMQTFKQQIETVGLELGQTILPFLEKVADWLNQITNNGEKWGAGVATTVALLAGVKVGGGMLQGAGRAVGGMAVKGAIVGGGALLKGSVKGIAGLLTGLKTPLLSLEFAFKGLANGLGSAVTALGGWKGALGKAGAVVAAAGVGAAVGTVIYNKAVAPALDKSFKKNYGKIFGDDEEQTVTSSIIGGMLQWGRKPQKQLTVEQREIQKERVRKKRIEKGFIAEKEKAEAEKAAVMEEKRIKLIEKRAQLEADILATSQQMSKFAESAGKLRAAQMSKISAEVQRMKLTGNLDTGKLAGMKSGAFLSIDSEVAATKKYIEAMKQLRQAQQSGGAAGKTVGEFASQAGWSQEIVDALQEQDSTMIDVINSQVKITQGEETIAKKTQQRQQILEQINSVYETHIKQSSLLADEAGLLVQIADSYAIGVGASAQMRMREFNALEGQIAQMDRQLQNWKDALASATDDDARLELTNKIQEGENGILQIQLKQAGIAKSMRDGWVEAIEAMNTGAGTFSKIVLDQNKGTAQSLKLAGNSAVISGRSGSLEGGYRTSERFSTLQGTAGQGLISGSSGKRNFAYNTTVGKLTGSEAEGVQWMARGRAARDMMARNKLSTSRGMTSAGFGASSHYEGQTAGDIGGTGMTMGSGGINVNVVISSDAQRTGEDIVRVIVPQLQGIFSQISAGVVDGVQFRR